MAREKGTPAIVVARDISYRILLHQVLASLTVTLRPGECWIVTGPNGSGKSILTEILAGLREPSQGTVEWPSLADPRRDAAVVSFEAVERVLSTERHNDQSSVMHGRLDPGRRVRDYLEQATGDADAARAAELAQRFGLGRLLDRGLRFLSTGEFRKTLLAAAVAREPALLVLDEPYDGLDVASRRELARLVDGLHGGKRCLVVVANRARDIPSTATHAIELHDGRANYCGTMEAWPGRHRADRAGTPPLEGTTPARNPVAREESATVVSMHGVDLAYGSTPVLSGINWEVRANDRWMISGPNGSGKSTLLGLITGDNPKAYGQRIEIFGHRKGSGESVWEIKRDIGIVSGDLQLAYPLRTTVEDTVLSGFHDSIGLYEQPGGYEREVARRWIASIGLSGREDRKLRELSFGMRRMVLVARAVVKSPALLIADEPCQGLDDHHAREVLELLDYIGAEHDHCLLYVTHNPEERLECITHTLELVPSSDGSRAVVHRVDAGRLPEALHAPHRGAQARPDDLDGV